MATIQWDHTVHYVNDLSLVIKKMNEYGLRAFNGGSHTQWGTNNVLSYFDLCYLEFLAVEDEDVARQIADPNEVIRDAVRLLPNQEILSRPALRTDNIEAVVTSLRANKLTVSPIMPGKRIDAQGNLIEWKMATIAGDYQGLAYPFVIEWKGTDDERRTRLTESGIIKPHPVGDVTVEQAIFEVSDPSAVAEHWESLFGFELVERSSDRATLKISDKHFVFKKGELNQLQILGFHTANEALKGTNITIGQGKYEF